MFTKKSCDSLLLKGRDAGVYISKGESVEFGDWLQITRSLNIEKLCISVSQ